MNVENTMEYKAKNLYNLSQVIDLNVFYVINIWGGDDIKLQGTMSDEAKKVASLLDVEIAVNEQRNGYITGYFKFEGVKYEIVLT